MKILLKKPLLKEGRYDSFTREISNQIMYIIKTHQGKTGLYEFNLPDGDLDTYSHESGINFQIYVYLNKVQEIKVGDKSYDFFINTFIDDDDEIVLEISIDVNSEPKSYEQIFYKINEDVRHEIEHYSQQIFTNKPKPVDSSTMDSVFKHHLEPSEIEALMYGFYRRAKLEKKPLDLVMLDDLNKEIESGNLTKRESEILLNIWVKYAKRRLPNAVYSVNY